MAAARKIVIEFLGDNKDLDKALDGSVKQSSRFSSALKNAGKVAAIGLAAGAVVAGKALFDMTKGAIEDEAAQQKLAQTLKTAAGATDAQIASTENWITAQGKAFGVADDDLRPALSKLAVATGDVGKAQQLASLAMDISAGSGKSLESVTAALAKAQTGSVAGLSRLGVATKNAAGETLSLDQIQAKLAKNYKGAAAAGADKLQGKMQRLKVALSEAGETIGAALIPVVTRMADWFVDKGLPAIESFAGFLSNNFGPAIQKVSSFFKDHIDIIAPIAGILAGAAAAMLAIAAVTKVWAAAQVILNAVMTANPIGILIVALGALAAGLVIAYKKSETFRKIVNGAFSAIKKVVTVSLNAVKATIKAVVSAATGIWRNGWSTIKAIPGAVLGAIKTVISAYFNGYKMAFKLIGTTLKSVFSAVWKGLGDLARNGLEKILDIIKGIPGKIGDLIGKFRDAGTSLIGAFIEGLGNAAGFVGDFAGKIWDAVKSVINMGIDKLNGMLTLEFHKGPIDISVSAPDIPHLARGGVVKASRGGTLALLGEGGADEAVVPLSGPHARSMGGDTIVNIYGALDATAVGKQIEQILIKRQRMTGRPMQFRAAPA